MIDIQNRRYIGSKTKLLDKIEQCLIDFGFNDQVDYTFADLFAGTGVVAYHFAQRGKSVIVNDLLYSNYICYKAFLGDSEIDDVKLNKVFEYFNSIKYESLSDNYFSDIYGDKYFSFNDARKIGFIREYIEDKKANFTDREYAVLLTALLYVVDKIANTVGHFEHFLSKKPIDSNFLLSPLLIRNTSNALIFNEDVNVLAPKIEADVVYLDPPYNARQYVNFYHVLENLARWNKPVDFEGTSMKFKRDHLKSGYSKKCAPILMRDLIQKIKAKFIIVSYNNTYNAKSGASNNKISEEELISILKEKGEVYVRAFDYKSFNSGKTDFINHKEKLYICLTK